MENKKSYKFSIITLAVIIAAMVVVCVVSGDKNVETPPTTEPSISETEPCIDEPVDEPNDFPEVDKKPIIYLYPTTPTEVSVKLGYPENLTCSYPTYNNGWTVLAHPNGDLIDTNTNRNLYSLYYEANVDSGFRFARTGFVVAKEDTIAFLEEKLAILGLNEHEAQEFIIYWLPVLEESNYNYIYFASEEEINSNMPLVVTPAPDTIIRIRMYFYGLESPINVIEQRLTPVERSGFTVVEWGGVQLDGIMPYRLRMPCGGIRRPFIRVPRLGGNS